MSEETWREKYDRERKERAAKDRKTFAKYQQHRAADLIEKKRDGAKYGGGTYTEWRYREATKDTETEYMVKETTFREFDNGDFYKHTSSTKRQKFLCVNGPLAGQRVLEDRASDYLLFNNASWSGGSRRDEVKIPTAVLVHKSIFEAKP